MEAHIHSQLNIAVLFIAHHMETARHEVLFQVEIGFWTWQRLMCIAKFKRFCNIFIKKAFQSFSRKASSNISSSRPWIYLKFW